MKNLKRCMILYLTIFLIVIASVGCSDGVLDNSIDDTVKHEVTLVEDRGDYTYEEGVHGHRPWNATRIRIINALPHSQRKVVSIAEQAIALATDQIDQQSNGGASMYTLFFVFYDTKDQVWIVSYMLPGLEPGTVLGGCVSVAIAKNNGKVLEIWTGE